jgi:hypothetical protein
VLTEIEDGRPAPAASPIKKIRPEKGGFVSMLVLDMDTPKNTAIRRCVKA